MLIDRIDVGRDGLEISVVFENDEFEHCGRIYDRDQSGTRALRDGREPAPETSTLGECSLDTRAQRGPRCGHHRRHDGECCSAAARSAQTKR